MTSSGTSNKLKMIVFVKTDEMVFCNLWSLEGIAIYATNDKIKNFLLHKSDIRIMFCGKKRTLAFTVLWIMESRAPAINSV